MSNVKKSWRDVTINEYYELVDIMEDDCEDYEKEVRAIAFLNSMDENEVWNLSIPQFRELQKSKQWITKFDINQNVTDFTVAQYIDFQTFWPHRNEMRKYIGSILTCFVIPHGMKYNEGYDIQKLAETIKESVDIMTANEIIFFFLSSFLNSTRATLTYLKAKAMRTERRMKKGRNKEEMLKVLDQIDQLQKSILDGFRLLTR